MSEVLEEIATWSDIVPAMAKIPITAYKNRFNIQKLWKRTKVFLNMGDTEIAVLGRPGVGKTVLLAQLTGTASDLSYKLPLASKQVETDVIRFGNPSRIVRVVPGHANADRYHALEEIFHKHEHLEGLIYVTDWGYTPIRDTELARQLVMQGRTSVEEMRAHFLDAELKDLEEVLARLRAAKINGRGPKWVLVVVNKADLFWDQLHEAESYYHPESGSAFAKIIANLQNEVGKLNIEFGIVPACAWPTEYKWQDHIVASQIGSEETRRNLLLHLFLRISQFSS